MVASSPPSTPSSSSSASTLVVVSGLNRARHRCDAVVASCDFSSLGGRGGGTGGDSVESTESTEAASFTKNLLKREGAAVSVPPRRRRVRFDGGGSKLNGIRSTVHKYEKVAEGEKGLCWYSKEDTLRMKQDVRRETSEFLRLHPDYVDCLEHLFRSPLVRRRPPTLASSSPASSSASPSSSDVLQEDDASAVAPAAFDRAAFVTTIMSREDAPRGLEYRMSYPIHRHKELTKLAVLRRQAQLQKEAAEAAALQHRGVWPLSSAFSRRAPPTAADEEALAMCSRRLSGCSRELAIEYGTADAIQAQLAYAYGGASLCLL